MSPITIDGYEGTSRVVNYVLKGTFQLYFTSTGLFITISVGHVIFCVCVGLIIRGTNVQLFGNANILDQKSHFGLAFETNFTVLYKLLHKVMKTTAKLV